MSTQGTVAGVFQGSTFVAAFTNPAGLDVLQVINEGGNVVWSLDKNGVVHTNPASPTTEALIARYFGSSVATAFTNPSSLDILQIVSPTGDSVVFHVDSTGTAHTP